MKTFFTGGGLGDVYVICCKLRGIKKSIKIIHFQPYKNYNDGIRTVFSLIPNIVELKILNKEYEFQEPYIYTSPKHFPDEPDCIKMNYFPNFEFKSNYNFNFPYIVLQPKSGREDQNREMKLKTIKKIIKISKYKVVLIGTEKKYKKIKNCINLTGRTNLFDAFKIIQKSRYFIGVFGIMAMVALSHKINCNFIYSTETELEYRVYGTPWEKYCKKIILLENYLLKESPLIVKIKIYIIMLKNKILKYKKIKYIKRFVDFNRFNKLKKRSFPFN